MQLATLAWRNILRSNYIWRLLLAFVMLHIINSYYQKTILSSSNFITNPNFMDLGNLDLNIHNMIIRIQKQIQYYNFKVFPNLATLSAKACWELSLPSIYKKSINEISTRFLYLRNVLCLLLNICLLWNISPSLHSFVSW